MIFNIPEKYVGTNEGEKKVHAKLNNLFSGKKYFALHSVGLTNHTEKLNGECDFVIVSDLGIFCLEVKGGPVSRKVIQNIKNNSEDANYKWVYSTYEKNESPFAQAEGAIYPIQEALERKDRKRRMKFLIGRGVIFPDIEFKEESPEWDQDEICSKEMFDKNFEFLKRC